jgi:hypothetical protein
VDIERETTMTQEDIDLFLEGVDIGYTRCNVKPITREWFEHTGGCIFGCGITAALINKQGFETFRDREACIVDRICNACKEFNLSSMFVDGFIAGFDGYKRYYFTDADYTKGYEYGREKREKWILKGKQK